MSTEKYHWYKLKPFATSADEEYDTKKDEDLLMLCKNIPDVLFQIFKTPQESTTIILRVPESYGRMVDAVDSFGSVFNESPIGMKINTFSTLHLAKKSVYPLVYDKKNVISSIFSAFKDIPFGVFGLKLLHSPSHLISKQYDVIRKKKNNMKKKISQRLIHMKNMQNKNQNAHHFFTVKCFME